MVLMRGQLVELNLPRVTIGLMWEEDQGGVSRLIVLAKETPVPESVVLESEEGEVEEATVDTLDALLQE